MSILIISDDPARESFRQILSLKQEIEGLIGERVDLITFSSDGVFLNQKWMVKELDTSAILSSFERLLKRRIYLVLIMSLKRQYLKQIFPEGWNILDLINRTSPQATVFIFGTFSIMKNIKRKQKAQPIFFCPRHGVAKLTKEFKTTIIKHIKAVK